MPFTAQEFDNIAVAALDFYLDRGKTHSQTIQEKPLYMKMDEASKRFSGGRGNVSAAVKGVYSTVVTGYTHDDTVTYVNPANNQRVNYPWREHHAGIGVTHTELKHDGISLSEPATGEGEVQHDDRELHALVNLLEDKYEDMEEGYERGMNTLLWGDGSGDAKAIAGIRSFILDDPDAGSTGGLARTNVWWRNRALTLAGGGLITSNAANGGALIQTLQKEWRQLRRYGGRPNCWLAGSDLIDALEVELRANGNYSDNGFSRRQEAGMGEVYFKGNHIMYDPTLDDIGRAKYLYAIDLRRLYLDYMQNERKKVHRPARPAERYVMYRAYTTTAVVCATQLNCHGVYQIA